MRPMAACEQIAMAEPECAARSVRGPPERSRVRFVLPGMRVRRATAGVQVMDEQCCHEHLGGGRSEDLDAKPVRPGVGFLSAIRKGVPGQQPACQREGLVVRP
jgi:hypothetical protein